MGKIYSEELNGIPATYDWVKLQNTLPLLRLLERWTGSYGVVIGSGGSYTAAAAISLFREFAFKSPTRAVSPLEFLSLADRIPATKALLLSAEGKNSDILAAAHRAISADLATAALTLTASNPLIDIANESHAIRVFSHDAPWKKDGYLATNSLVAMTLLSYKALFGDDRFNALGEYFSAHSLKSRRAFFSNLHTLHDATDRSVLVIHGASASTFAIALESNLSEAAIANVEVADLRQFAHGRHLQLSARSKKPLLVFAFGPFERKLSQATMDQIPADVPFVSLELRGATDAELAVTGLLDALLVTEMMAKHLSYDPGSPSVATFSRNIHRLNTAALMQLHDVQPKLVQLAAARKLVHVDCSDQQTAAVEESAQRFIERLQGAQLKAVVCDFDGTLCRIENRYDGIDPRIVKRLIELMDDGLVVAIATGRGKSLRDLLLNEIPDRLQGKILIGYYSGGSIHYLSDSITKPDPSTYAEELINWLQHSIFRERVLKSDKILKGGQLTLGVKDAHEALRLQGTIRAKLNLDGYSDWRAFCSGHSVDVLDNRTTKLNVTHHVARTFGINAETEILRIGDSGGELGNDYELLGQGLSLSSDSVSTCLETCWNFAGWGCNQAEATLRYLNAIVRDGAYFRIKL